MTPSKQNKPVKFLPKTPTEIPGLDEITDGGLPKDRTTLIAGGPGCGKTLFAMEFLVNGAVQYNEPGVFMAFEESAEAVMKDVKTAHGLLIVQDRLSLLGCHIEVNSKPGEGTRVVISLPEEEIS